MDKRRFTEIAPIYYALAIAHFFLTQNGRATSRRTIGGYYDNALGEDLLFERAVLLLIEKGGLVRVQDDFGPDILAPTDDLEQALTGLTSDQSSPAFRFGLLDHDERRGWLVESLRSVNVGCFQLSITSEDFESGKDEEKWEPLPLDRSDPSLQKVITKIDETIDGLRKDNGYNATFPTERNYVVSALSDFAARIKENASISIMYVRAFALEPLASVARRFKDHAIGILAQVARQAIREWLIKHGVHFLDDIWRS